MWSTKCSKEYISLNSFYISYCKLLSMPGWNLPFLLEALPSLLGRGNNNSVEKVICSMTMQFWIFCTFCSKKVILFNINFEKIFQFHEKLLKSFEMKQLRGRGSGKSYKFLLLIKTILVFEITVYTIIQIIALFALLPFYYVIFHIIYVW